MSPPLWHAGNQRIPFTDRTRIMGVVNITPDSFSDGGSFLDPSRAVQHGISLAEEGADLLDVGGESTRPGSEAVSGEQEVQRILPVLRELRSALPDILLSVDTSKASVASAAISEGADIINDVTAGRGDPRMFSTVADSEVGYVLMHMQGIPRTMQKNPVYVDLLQEVSGFLEKQMAAAQRAGIAEERIALDPGIGFGKNLGHNVTLLSQLGVFQKFGRPLVLGVSRKRWIGELTGREVDQRLAGSLAGAAVCIERGAHLLRVHDVAETVDVARIVDRVRRL